MAVRLHLNQIGITTHLIYYKLSTANNLRAFSNQSIYKRLIKRSSVPSWKVPKSCLPYCSLSLVICSSYTVFFQDMGVMTLHNFLAFFFAVSAISLQNLFVFGALLLSPIHLNLSSRLIIVFLHASL